MSKNSKSKVPGEPTGSGTSLLETATAAIQAFAPVNKIHQHLCAFHFYSHDMTRQVEAHHLCGHQNEEMRQCLIYDSPEANARLIGLEYIVSENLFMTLPDEEKRLWHSHDCGKRLGVDHEKERMNREYMKGPEHGIDPLANGGGKGLKTVLREVHLPNNQPPPSATRVFV
ncbi:oil body-associated protein 1A [Arachis ipaensis]|uniref:oil body-associated protein 1A n=1 Tax=Arachis ipaensis TaxID=130454 RepID=UPI000A2B3E2B|nr:oil body-associated protein 1A [Arachis ipaensis]